MSGPMLMHPIRPRDTPQLKLLNDEIYNKYKSRYELLGSIYYYYKDALNKEKEKEEKEKKEGKKINKYDEFILNYQH